MLGLGFASGLPFLLIGNTLSYWLGDAHVNLALIGYLSWVGLAYSLKFIWGAVVDSVPAPLFGRLGQRRGWMVWMQLGVVVGLAGMAASDPKLRLAALTGFALVTAASMSLGLLATVMAKEPKRADRVLESKARAGFNPRRVFDVVVGPFIAFFRQWGPVALLILLTVSAYHLSDYLRGPVINPFYVQVGLHKSTVAAVRLAIGLPTTLVGIAAGGLFAARFGHMPTLIVGALLQPVAVAAFGLLALTGPSLPVFSGLTAFDDFAGNFAGAALIAYMSTLTQLGYTATQYALLTSALAWTGKLLKGWSGAAVLGIAHGGSMARAYALFFCGAGAFGAVAIVLCLLLAWTEARRLKTAGALATAA